MRLRTLAGLALEGSSFRRVKPLLFLCYLSLEGPRPRRELAELFWMQAKDPRDSLSVAISQLRSRFPAIVEADRERVWTDTGCDARDLLELVHAGRLDAAVTAYRGPFLEGLDLPMSEELEEWVFVTREYVAGRVRDALLRLGEREAAAGQLAAAAARGEAAYLLREAPEPGPEDFRRLHALLRAGGSPYAEGVRASAESYGITLSLKREPLRSDGGAIRHNLPTPSTSFIGRDPELLEISALLNRPECRLVTVHGPGGIGKSRLALQAAHDLVRAGEFEGGVFLVPLDTLTSPELIPGSITEALEVQVRGRDDPLALIGRAVGERATLLLLDNFEHLMMGIPLLTTLLDTCPKLKILVTSRERLNLAEEWVLTLEGLPTPPAATTRLEDASHYGAFQLFLDRARRARLDVSLSDADLPPLLKIFRLVGSAPLGIELAAVWIKVLPIAEIAEEVGDNLGFLEASNRNVAERHHSIEAAFEHSWKLLNLKEQTVLGRLSVFVGGFRREAAAYVTGATLAILVSLVDKSLLSVSAGGRYDRHPLVDRFTRDKLSAQPEAQREVRERHASYYLDLVETQHAKLGSKRRKEALAAFEDELENVRSAWRWAIAQGWVATIRRCAGPLSELYEKHHLEGVDVFAGAAGALDEGDPDHRGALGHVLVAEADQLYGLGRDEQATRRSERALELLRPLNDDLGVMRGVFCRGQLARRGGDLAEARANFREGFELATTLRLPRATAWFSAWLARVEIEQGYSPCTERYCREVLAQLRELGHLDILAGHLSNFGWLYLFHALGWQAAKPLFEEGLQLAKTFDMPLMLAPLLDGLARIARDEGDLERARAYLREGLELSRKQHDTYAETFLSLTLATVEMVEGAYYQAHQLLLRCLQTAQRQRHRKLLFRNLTLLADLGTRRDGAVPALTWASLVCHHPSAPERDKTTAQRLMERLRNDIPTEDFRAAVERGKTVELEDVVAGILDRAKAGSDATSGRGSELRPES